MYPTRSAVGRGKSTVEEAEASAPVVLGASCFCSEEALAKVRGLVADAFNKGGTIEVRVGSDEAWRCSGALQQVFTHALMAGLVPPFSAFFLEILRHYRIHLLTSIQLRSPFSPSLPTFVRRSLAWSRPWPSSATSIACG